MNPDWELLARSLGALRSSSESGGDEIGRRAIVQLLGRETVEDAVEWYIAKRPGYETARSVLMVLRPTYAIEKCLAVYNEAGSNASRRRSAVELLRSIASKSELPWVEAFLKSGDSAVASWGSSLLEQIVLSGTVDAAEVEYYVRLCEEHHIPIVRDNAAAIRKCLN